MSIDEKKVWITGASAGIGRSLAIEISQRCSHLVLSGRRISELEKTAGLCNTRCKTFCIAFDISDLHIHEAKVDQAIAACGHLDIIVHNAGVSQRSTVVETDIEVYRRLMDINYMGAVQLTRLVLPHFLERSSGQIVVMSSLVGKFGSPFRSGYAAAKHALHGFFDSLRLEVEKHGIAVTVLCPGFIHTHVSMNALTADGQTNDTMDPKTAQGMSPEAFAQKAVRVIDRRKREAYIGGKEILSVYVKRFWPRLFHYILSRSQVR